MAVSEGPKILVAEKGVLASRSWMVHHSADGVHVVSLDDDGWPSRGSPPLSTQYASLTVDARGRGHMCIWMVGLASLVPTYAPRSGTGSRAAFNNANLAYAAKIRGDNWQTVMAGIGLRY